MQRSFPFTIVLFGITVLGVIAVFAAGLNAQVSTASVRGTIRDSSGAQLPGVTLALKNRATGVEKRTSSTGTGDYLFLDVPVGQYDLQASRDGFTTQKIERFVLQVNQATTLDLTLTVGSTHEVIQVQAQAEALQTATAETGNVVNGKEVTDVPLNSRNFTNLLLTAPGVSPVQVAQTWTSPIGTYVLPSVNGATNRSNIFILDGVFDSETFGNSYAIPPSIDTIQELKLQEHNDSAEFGGSLGGTVNVVTRSGTNDFHGTVYEFLQNDALNARNKFAPSKQVYRQNQFGVTVGGPILIPKLYNGRNKTFFFFGYDGFRFLSPSLNFFNLPTAAELSGNFTGLNPIYDPATTTLNSDGTYSRTQFPNNIIPQNRLNAGNLYYVQHVLPIGSPTDIIPGANYLDRNPSRVSQVSYNGRIDENLGSKDSMFFRVTTINQVGSGGPAFNPLTFSLSGNQFSTSWVHVFSPTKILQLQGGRTYTQLPATTTLPTAPKDFLTTIGFTQGLFSGFAGIGNLIPGINVSGVDLTTNANNAQTTADSYTIRGNYTWVVGKHMLKTGGELNKIGEYLAFLQDFLSYGPDETALPTASATTGNPLASFVLGLPEQAAKRNAVETMRWGGVLGAYFQDQWKATSRLTLNLGLRWDHTFMPPFGTKAAGNEDVGNFNFNNGTYELLKTPPPSCALAMAAPCIPTPDGSLPAGVYVSKDGKIWHMGWREFQPRIGVAYRLFRNTAVRGAFGIVFDNYAGMVQTGREIGGTWPSTGQLLAFNLNSPTPTNPFPNVTPQNLPGLSSLPAPTPYTQIGFFTDPKLTVPYSEQWNFGVQQELSPTTVVTVNYVGQSSHRLNYGGLWNVALTPGPGDPTLRQPFPNISQEFYTNSAGSSNYNALQVQFNRRVSKGFGLTVAYTRSKTIDVGCSGFFGSEGCATSQIYNPRADRSVAAYDLPNVLSLDFTYELPIGKGKWLSTNHGALDYILGNWQTNGIMWFDSGSPFTITVPGDIANIGTSGYERPNLIGDPNLAHRTPAAWFNTAAFGQPAPFTYGNVGRNSMRSPNNHEIDISLFREFPIHDRFKLQFRGEAFNVFNNVVYGTPGSVVGQPLFGVITSTANSARTLQVAGKIIF